MLNVGVIGAGNWGKNLVRVFAEMESVRLSCVADRSPEARDAVMKRHPGVRTADDARTVIADPSIDAVVVAAPAVMHHAIVRDSLLAGKHVFVEKPMTLDVPQARELVRLADEKRRVLMVGHLLLYHPCVVAVRDMIARGEIGEVRYIYTQRLNLGKVRSDENALVSLAPHDISVILDLIGLPPVSAGAFGRCFLQEKIEDVVFLTLRFPGKAMAHIHVSWLDPHKVRRITVVGTKKMVVFDDMEPQEKVRVYDKGVDRRMEYGSYGEFLSLRDGDISIPDIPMIEPLRCECGHFIECILSGGTPLSDGRNGLAVTRVLDAGLRSLENGGAPAAIEEDGV